MADIAMCYGKSCTEKKSCYRFTATANEYRQSYFTESPILPDGSCEYYWTTKSTVVDTRKLVKRPADVWMNPLTAQQEYSATMSKDNNA